MVWYEYIDKKISNLFYHYGKLIARHPRSFLVGSLTLAAILSLGVVFLTFETDAAYLFTPDVSRARDELAYMEEHYLPDYDNFWMSRSLTTEEKMGNLIVIPKDGENVLTDEIINEVLQIDVELNAMKVKINKTYSVNFTQVCGRWNGNCLSKSSVASFVAQKTNGGKSYLNIPKNCSSRRYASYDWKCPRWSCLRREQYNLRCPSSDFWISP